MLLVLGIIRLAFMASEFVLLDEVLLYTSVLCQDIWDGALMSRIKVDVLVCVSMKYHEFGI